MRLTAHLLPVALAGQIVCVAHVAAAQASIVIESPRRDTLSAETGGVVTAAFDVRNRGAAPTHAVPKVDVPAGWSVVVGNSSFTLDAGARELWFVGVAPSATTPAGTYAVRVRLFVAGAVAVTDTLNIRVPERRGLEVFPGDAPLYAMAGDGYPVSFFVRNRGNVTTTVSLHATTSVGAPPRLEPSSVTIPAGATATIRGRVSSDPVVAGWNTRECVVELVAQDDADSSVTSSVSLRTTIVPRSRGWLTNLTTVPAQLTVRSVGANSGVSPALLVGSGALGSGGSTQVDFLLRAPVSGTSLFGERDEYRIAVSSDRYRLRLGDNLFGFSELTSSWMSGFGAELRGDVGPMTAGGYVKEDRWSGLPGSERAVSIGTSTRFPFSASLIGLDRTGARNTDARMGAIASQVRLGAASTLEVESAMSDSGGIDGAANRARVFGDYARGSYDVGLTLGTRDFVGRDRGQTTGHAGFTARITDWASLTANTSTLRFVPAFDEASFSSIRSSGVEANLFADRIGLVYEDLSRADSGVFAALGGEQRGGRIRASVPVRWLNVSADLASGNARRGANSRSRYTSATVTLHAAAPALGSIDIFAQRNEGTVFEMPGTTAATTVMLRLPWTSALTVSAYGSIPQAETRIYYGQIDAELGHTLSNGMMIVLRNRVSSSPLRAFSTNRNLFFVELRAPLRIPTGRARANGFGSARGRIFDAESGRGVGGVLVRLGSEAAVTDGQGRVSFASLPPGKYHASVEGAANARLADALLTGDVAVEVDSQATKPASFTLSLARGGQVRVDVHQFDFTTTLANASADSIVDAGGFPSAMVALIGARDTLYQLTNQDGVANFRDVPVGRWTVQLAGATLPESHILGEDASAVTVLANARATVGIRIVPKRRAVQFVPAPPIVIARPTSSPKP